MILVVSWSIYSNLVFQQSLSINSNLGDKSNLVTPKGVIAEDVTVDGNKITGNCFRDERRNMIIKCSIVSN